MIRLTRFIDTSGGLEPTAEQLADGPWLELREAERALKRTQALHLLAFVAGVDLALPVAR